MTRSTVREIAVSAKPPKKPAIVPSTIPMKTEMEVASSATISEVRTA